MIAKEYGQPPHEVAEWDPEWLAAAVTVMAATGAAEEELRRREARKRKNKSRGA